MAAAAAAAATYLEVARADGDVANCQEGSSSGGCLHRVDPDSEGQRARFELTEWFPWLGGNYDNIWDRARRRDTAYLAIDTFGRTGFQV